MSSNKDKSTSANPSQKQDNRSDIQNSQRSIIGRQDSSSEEGPNIMKYLNDNKKTLKERYGFLPQSSKKRVPRYYFINQNQTILIILQGDITKTKVDAVVNAANEHMTGGSGVDGMIHRVAGPKLYDACVAHKELKYGVRLPTGHSRILLSYNMSSTTYYIINTAGPVYNRQAAAKCAEKLTSCYKTALDLANLYNLESIGFTAISCGIFGYPANDGADVALRTVDQNAGSIPVVVFVLWDDHIYDAWVKKAEELKFTQFDPESAKIESPPKSSIDHDEKSNRNNNEPKSPTTFNPPVRDHSTPNETEKTSEDTSQHLIETPPSVPNELSNTQQTENMDQSDNPVNVNDNLHTQQTVEMANVNLEEQKSITTGNSEQQLAQEETNKSDSEKTTTDDHRQQPKDQEGIEKTDGERATTDAVLDEHPHATTTDSPIDQH